MQKVKYSIEILAVPGKPIPNVRELKKILDETLEPHLAFKVSRSKNAC